MWKYIYLTKGFPSLLNKFLHSQHKKKHLGLCCCFTEKSPSTKLVVKIGILFLKPTLTLASYTSSRIFSISFKL